MATPDWLPEYLARLADEQVVARGDSRTRLAPAHRLYLDAAHFGSAARVAREMGLRHAGSWADPPGSAADRGPDAPEAPRDQGPLIGLFACLERDGGYLVLETAVPETCPELPSQTPAYIGLDRLERHAMDLTGVRFTGHPDPRRWTRHQAWAAGRHPLRADFPLTGDDQRRAPADVDYPFRAVAGSGVYEIPVGPVHAGIIEPGHFRFSAVGEEVLALEERLGYVHKGIEKLAVGRDPAGAARLAARVSGDSTVAHGWAACQAMERACGCEVPARGLALRGLFAERERVANHLGDLGAICNDVGLGFLHAHCGRLRELWQRRSHALFGHRLLMDRVIPGGVAVDLDAAGIARLRADHVALRGALPPLFTIIDDLPSLVDRLLTTGTLSPADAAALGCTGYVGKASGQAFDVRRDASYPPYDRLTVAVPAETAGDVAARARVRMAEVDASLNLLDTLLDTLPRGTVAAPLPVPDPGATGLGLVDGWRGEVLTYVRFGADGRIARLFPRDPSWFTWPALERLIHGNIVPDFPVCNKSVNGSYSGVDL